MVVAYRSGWISTGEKPVKVDRRDSMEYYKVLLQVIDSSPHRDSIVDVGSGFPPFLRFVKSVPSKTVLAPYFANYARVVNNTGFTDWSLYPDHHVIQADFMQAEMPCVSFDIVLCSQVLEHIQDAGAFMQKLLRVAPRTVIVSVPYKWPNTNQLLEQRLRRFITGAPPKVSHHKHDDIDEETLLRWSGGRQPDQSYVVREEGHGRYSRRIIQVYSNPSGGDGAPRTLCS
eukprot:CAMPEP_0114417808 /NCGR_PEP_ID=MMETSP0103-20121206/3162_1 /TAXON_ID=37642 ORGANISM="Paraphysomonas imperforata, Strain PA2" /NCGR_SAMPLE_ID=MMETSP0103 /ASSEMBLY_ACC=CAM_ASM_000201 /LENGTH=228 /DNA_ID=CAMNT_0001586127 /DNA_START=271 /DNA_END=957 /DNA_ORIENTATION=+